MPPIARATHLRQNTRSAAAQACMREQETFAEAPFLGTPHMYILCQAPARFSTRINVSTTSFVTVKGKDTSRSMSFLNKLLPGFIKR